MSTAKIFKNGNSQAVRLPKEFQFDVTEVEIFRRGEEVVLRKKHKNLEQAFDILAGMPDDFCNEKRVQPRLEHREKL